MDDWICKGTPKAQLSTQAALRKWNCPGNCLHACR